MVWWKLICTPVVAVLAVLLGLKERAALRRGISVDVPGHLEGKHVVLTGGSSGIGFSTAVLLCRMGAHVILHGPDQNRTQRAASDVMALVGKDSRATPLAAELDDFGAVRQMAGRVSELVPQVHLLVLNAAFNYGAAPVFGPWAKIRMEALPASYFVGKNGGDHVMAVNHLGHFLLTVLLMPRLAPDASIVIVTGNGMWQGDWRRLVLPGRYAWEKQRARAFLAYEDSKLANMCFGRALRKQVRPGQTVVVHDPGQIRTTMTLDRQSPAYRNKHYLTAPADRRWVWWHMSTEQAAERMVRAAFVTRQPVPDVAYSYWMPAEIFRHLNHHSLVVRRNWMRTRWPVKFLKSQYWGFGPLYEGVGPGCGDRRFLEYFWNYSLQATGLGDLMDQSEFSSYYTQHLASTLGPVLAQNS